MSVTLQVKVSAALPVLVEETVRRLEAWRHECLAAPGDPGGSAVDPPSGDPASTEPPRRPATE